MINLLPPAAKRHFVREYYMRLAVIALWMGVGITIAIILLLTPSYVLLTSQLRAYDAQLASANETVDEQAQLQERVQAANEQIATVNALVTVEPVGPYIETIEALQGQSVRISALTVTRTETSVSSITVSGEAATRESLTSFSAALTADERFLEANVPIENLAANRNIPFSLTIAVAGVET